MLKDNAFIYWFLILMPPILGLTIFLVQGTRLKRMNNQYGQLMQRFHSAERIIEVYEKNRLQTNSSFGKLPGDGLISDTRLLALLGKAETMCLMFDFEGKVLFVNEFARERIGIAAESDVIASFLDFCSRRLQAIVLSEFRRQQSGAGGRVLEVQFLNRFNEEHRLKLQLLTDQAEGKVLVLATEKEKVAGFGVLRYGRLLETILYRSRWPSLLLEKSGKYGGWRNSRIIWLSASAGRLFEIEPLKAAGIPLGLLSSGLSQQLPEQYISSAGNRIWHKSGKEYYQMEITADADHILLILKRIESGISMDETESPEVIDSFAGGERQISFSGLLNITGGDEDFIRMLLPSYLTALRDCRADFRVFAENADAARLRFLHHKIKATIRTFGLHQLDQIFYRAIELVEKAGIPDREELNGLLAELNTSCLQTEQALLDFARDRNLQV